MGIACFVEELPKRGLPRKGTLTWTSPFDFSGNLFLWQAHLSPALVSRSLPVSPLRNPFLAIQQGRGHLISFSLHCSDFFSPSELCLLCWLAYVWNKYKEHEIKQLAASYLEHQWPPCNYSQIEPVSLKNRSNVRCKVFIKKIKLNHVCPGPGLFRHKSKLAVPNAFICINV